MEKNITKIQEIFYELRVEEVMTAAVITVMPQTSMRELGEILRVHRISGTPVLDGGKLVGVVSIMDLIHALERGQVDQPVGERMTRQVDVLYDDERVITAIGKLQRTGYGRFPVLNRSTGSLVGILTQGDVIKGTLKQLDLRYRQQEMVSERSQYFFQDVVSQDTCISLRYVVKARDFVHGGEASSQFKRSLQKLGVPPSILRRVAVATYEAEMNLILHADDGGQIDASVRADTIRVDVSDKGPGIADVKQAMQPGFSTASAWIREMGFGAGMGLVNIENCADEMSIESQVGVGTQLHLLFRLDGVKG